MTDRTLVKVSAYGDSFVFRTVSPERKSPHTFYVPRRMFAELERTGEILCQDILSFARFFRDMTDGTLIIQFSWLSQRGKDRLEGWEQMVRLPYDAFSAFIKDSAEKDGRSDWIALSVASRRMPKLVFCGKESLHAALDSKLVRRKLVKFLRDNFKWPGADEIRFYNDFVPYSFFFREIRSGEPVMCGGLILHGQDNMAKAAYSIHT